MAYLFVLISSTVNDAIYQFRGAELLPADLLSVKTALNVADGYHYAVGSYVKIRHTKRIFCFTIFYAIIYKI